MAEQKLIHLKINDRDVEVPQGTLLIEATRRIGTEVPSFCYYPGLSLQAACRMCMVEIEKAPKLQTGCTVIATEGMIVRTDTEQVRNARKYMLEFLLTNHPLDCPVCDKGGECELQDMVFRYGADSSRFVEEKIHRPEEKWSELVYYDAPRCILCFRCVRVCDEGMDVKALGVGMRGANSVIIPNREDHLECEECGMCIDICPVGALTSGTYRYKTRPWEMAYVSTVCTHCSNGCKTTLSVRNHEILRSNNRDLSGLNKDFLCVKGRFGFDFTSHPERIRQPLVRKGDKLYPVSWEEAAQAAATRLKAAHASGGSDSIGFIGSNRTSNEENYLLQKLARTAFGTNNIDHHRTADYTGLITALGERAADSMLTMEQLYESKAVLLVGNDPTNQNPLVAWQIRSGIRHFGTKLFVINANEIKLKRKATQFVKVEPGQEAAVFKWLAHEEGQFSPELVEQLVLLKAALEAAGDVAVVFGAEISGVATPQMVEAAQAGKLQALYVVGANPLTHFDAFGVGRGKLDLLIVHEMFLTETAKAADIVFPATSAYEKDGTVTNTSGEIQMLHKGAEVMGPRSDFDLLRILSHQLEKLGLGKAFHYKNPAAVFKEIRKAVSGYNVQSAGLLTGGAEPTRVEFARNGHAPYDVPVGLIRPAKDNLFTSGTLGRFCKMMESLPEAKA